jgi:hypothetical protein
MGYRERPPEEAKPVSLAGWEPGIMLPKPSYDHEVRQP